MRKMIKCGKERIKLKRSFVDFVRFYALLMAMFGVSVAGAAQAPNPRSATPVNASASQRATGNTVVRGDGGNAQYQDSAGRATTARSATGVRAVSSARSATSTRSGGPARSATVARSAISGVRGGTNVSDAGLARAGSRARATAVFTDISKIGGGYAACREAYATCMDQFCANANDTYRRCYCSEKFTEFRDTENALDEAKTQLIKPPQKLMRCILPRLAKRQLKQTPVPHKIY